jgi:NAD-dependent SIR2 family protein deacetylase
VAAESDTSAALDAAAAAVKAAGALLITAGAGMGVDSGLPDFRGNEGFWNAYPPFRKLGLSFVDLANPEWFRRDPTLAWGFYGHRLALYRATQPHEGFRILLRWAERLGDHFVFTSNVDGAFQRAGFDGQRIAECHGAIDFVQCTSGHCSLGIVPADAYTVDIDLETFRARGRLPTCPRCSAVVRPNILMFGDWGFDSARSDAQEATLGDWLRALGEKGTRLVVIECGAGTAIPTVRRIGERMLGRGAQLVRINVREPEVPAGGIGIASGALSALSEIDERLSV